MVGESSFTSRTLVTSPTLKLVAFEIVTQEKSGRGWWGLRTNLWTPPTYTI